MIAAKILDIHTNRLDKLSTVFAERVIIPRMDTRFIQNMARPFIPLTKAIASDTKPELTQKSTNGFQTSWNRPRINVKIMTARNNPPATRSGSDT